MSRRLLPTATGRQVDLGCPTPEMIAAEDIASALPLMASLGGHQQANRFEFAYSVAQHSLLVARLVSPELALTGLLREAWKAYTGDQTLPWKYYLNEATGGILRRAQERLQRAVAERFGLIYPPPEEVEEASLRARATAYRDLMAPLPLTWSLELPEPIEERIVPEHPRTVRAEFVEKWLELDPQVELVGRKEKALRQGSTS